MAKTPAHELRARAARALKAPALPYQPRLPKTYRPGIGLIGCGSISSSHLRAYKAAGLPEPGIGLIGCGSISSSHLRAYKAAGLPVVALCDIIPERARARQKEFFPGAAVYDNHVDLLGRDDLEVVDIATHPRERTPLITAALESGRHVLSQKPFVVDLDVGARLADLADRKGVKLAVNQNGRWAPYFSWMRQAVARGLVGDPWAVHMECHWNHEIPLLGTDFDRIHHIIFYDFAIHWFDALHTLMGSRRALRASASVSRAPGQKARPPLLAQAGFEFEDGQATLVFDALTRDRSVETVFVAGTSGSLSSEGEVCNARAVTLSTAKGSAVVPLTGQWFVDGFVGTMGELLRAIHEKREPSNGARDNLESLALCFAAIVASDKGRPQEVGAVRRLPLARCTPTAR